MHDDGYLSDEREPVPASVSAPPHPPTAKGKVKALFDALLSRWRNTPVTKPERKSHA